MSEATPVAETPVTAAPVAEAPKPSPARDLREIQFLLAEGGLFPGKLAPMVHKAFNLLDKMAAKVEADANEAAK